MRRRSWYDQDCCADVAGRLVIESLYKEFELRKIAASRFLSMFATRGLIGRRGYRHGGVMVRIQRLVLLLAVASAVGGCATSGSPGITQDPPIYRGAEWRSVDPTLIAHATAAEFGADALFLQASDDTM